MLRLAVLVLFLAASAVSAAAESQCPSPRPVYRCEDWRRNITGRLVSVRPVAAGLIEIGANGYLGDNTIIDGIDYTEALYEQCGGR